MLELKTGYMNVTAKRSSKQSDWLTVQIELTGHKPLEQIKDDLFEHEWFMYTTFRDYFCSQYQAETAMVIFSDGDKMLPIPDDKLPIVSEYPFPIRDIASGLIEKEVLINAVLSSKAFGLLTEEMLLRMEAFRYIRENIPYIDYWEYDLSQNNVPGWSKCN